jgi:hypothetical protein
MEEVKMPYGILTSSMCTVNDRATKNSVTNRNFVDLDLNDILENIKILLNYINDRKNKEVKKSEGDNSVHYTIICQEMQVPSQKALF